MDDLYIEDSLTEALDEMLAYAKEKKNSPILPVFGLSGFGKTAVTQSWLNHYNLKHVYFTSTTLDEKTMFQQYSDILLEKDTIVVFDDYAFAKDEVRKEILNLVISGYMKCGEGMYITNVRPLMFVMIATIDPSTIARLTEDEIKIFNLEKYKK